MKINVTNIDWNVSDKAYIDTFGSLRDKDDLPYVPADLGLPAFDETVSVEIDHQPGMNLFEEIDKALLEEYEFSATDFDYKIVEVYPALTL